MPEGKWMPDVNKEVYKEDFSWQEGEYTVTRSAIWSAPGCHEGCGVLYYTKDNKVVKVEGDPNFALTQGRLCMRCLDVMEAFDHPDRLKWPLKRVGERGENKWERISWDEAYDIIVEKVRAIQQEYGPQSIVGLIGTGRNACWQVPYLTYAGFGSPNFTLGFLSGDACKLPRNAITANVNGGLPVVDCAQFFKDRYDNPEYVKPEVIIIWGCDPIVSSADGFIGHWITDLMKMGTKIIMIDPALRWTASRAEMWLRIRPGTDAALALGMLNVIINEDLYDHDFVEKWTHGFDELVERVQQYPTDKVAEITWIPENQIIEAARMFAKAKPAAIQWGLAIDQQVNGVHAAHAINALWAITGNLDVPGGMVFARKAYDANTTYSLGYYDWIPEELRAIRLGNEKYPLMKYGYSASAHSDAVLEAIESGKPYP
jgi:anaerobic selenocysteine-containing dehydrogenase